MLVKQIDRKTTNGVSNLAARPVIDSSRLSAKLDWLCNFVPIARDRFEFVDNGLYNALA
ncbi:hypothetical protein D9M69_622700 [compost metagenome]